MHLGVPNLGIGGYLTEEVYRSLDLQVVSRLLPFDDQGGTHNMVACHDVQEEGFSPFGSDEDWGRHQGRFEAFESLLGFLSPNEGVCLFEETVEWHPPFAKPGDEVA